MFYFYLNQFLVKKYNVQICPHWVFNYLWSALSVGKADKRIIFLFGYENAKYIFLRQFVHLQICFVNKIVDVIT